MPLLMLRKLILVFRSTATLLPVQHPFSLLKLMMPINLMLCRRYLFFI